MLQAFGIKAARLKAFVRKVLRLIVIARKTYAIFGSKEGRGREISLFGLLEGEVK